MLIHLLVVDFGTDTRATSTSMVNLGKHIVIVLIDNGQIPAKYPLLI